MNKYELANRVAEDLGIDQRTARKMVRSTVEHIRRAVIDGETVAFDGFGSFAPVERAPRTARNPVKNTPVDVPAKTVPVFRASPVFRADVTVAHMDGGR